MQAGNSSQHQQNGGRASPAQLTSLTLRSMSQLYDINLRATRVLLQTQARAASVFGFPDLSDVFNQVDERARNVFSASAEQLVENARRANEAATELQRQIGRVVETQATTAAETLQHGLEELGSQTSDGLQQLCETARQQADEAERVAQTLSQEMRETLRQGSEHLREAIRQGSEQVNEATREGGQQIGNAAHQAGDQAREAMDRGAQQGVEAAQRGRDATLSGNGNGNASAQPGQPGQAGQHGDEGRHQPGGDDKSRKGKGPHASA